MIIQIRIITNNPPTRRISRRRFASHGREALIDAAIEFGITRCVAPRDTLAKRIHETTKTEQVLI